MIRRAANHETEALMRLINAAFAVEKFFIESDRISLAEVGEYFQTGAFLVAEDDGEMAACIYVELRGERGYFGLLSVDPIRQRSGLGRRLIAAAEEFCRDAGCRFMDMRIVNLREELPAYYTKLGYVGIGVSPFPPEVETKLPCHFVEMSKALA
jgi:N-acetylglutamate synthase-like GNAT family acetyltransferase